MNLGKTLKQSLVAVLHPDRTAKHDCIGSAETKQHLKQEPWTDAELVGDLFARAQAEMSDQSVLHRQAMLKRSRISAEWKRSHDHSRGVRADS